jgi:Transposase IS66 family
VTAAEPSAESRWAFGPRLQAAVVTLAVRNRVSRRDATELARELFGVEISTGTVDAIVQRAGEALAAPHTRLEQEIKRSPVVNIDETGWKTGGDRRMLWGALTRRTAVFRIAAGRHAAEAQTMLGERYDGIVCSDRWAAYDYLDPTRRQLCWAHLLRDFTAHSEGMGEQENFGNAGLVVAHDLFDAWQRFQQDGERAALQARIAPPQTKPRAELEHASRNLDLQPHRWRRANQQPRRTRPPRRGHLPQALARHPIRTRRTQPRATPLRLDHLQAPQAIALRLPHRDHHRPRPWRPDTRPRLTTQTAERLPETSNLEADRVFEPHRLAPRIRTRRIASRASRAAERGT